MGKTESNTPHTQYQTPIQPVYRETVRVFTITHTGKNFYTFLPGDNSLHATGSSKDGNNLLNIRTYNQLLLRSIFVTG